MSRWKPFNPNGGGRNVEDCAVRALCAATGKSWREIRVNLDVISFATWTMSHSNDVWGAYLLQHGFRKRFLPESCLDHYTAEQFAADHPEGVYVLALSGHVVCCRDGSLWDTWDSGRETVIYYFERMD